MSPDEEDIQRLLHSSTSESTVKTNVAQDFIVTTKDKLHLALHEMLPRYTSKENALAMASAFLAFLAAVITADFQATFGISASAWRTTFVLCTIISGCLTIREVYKWLRRPKIADMLKRIMETDQQGS